MARANVFSSLFSWQPNDSLTPEENFLTEAFVHTLRRSEAAALAFSERVLAKPALPTDIDTRAGHRDLDTGTTIFPDILFTYDIDPSPVQVMVEVKWRSPYNAVQLSRYDRLLQQQTSARLVFICSDRRAQMRALADAHKYTSGLIVLTWEEVFDLLKPHATEGSLVEEFTDFMTEQALAPVDPISDTDIRAFTEARPVIARLMGLAAKLHNESDFDYLPARYQRYAPSAPLTNRYGRVALEMRDGVYEGQITVGFLYDNNDHKVPFTDLTRQIDLFLRIECSPGVADQSRTLVSELKSRLGAVRSVGGMARAHGDRDNKNRHTLFIAQASLAQVLAGSSSQISAIDERFKGWCNALFNDGVVAAELARLADAAR